MPYLETPDELADELANKLGVYGMHEEESCSLPYPCRSCFTSGMAERMRAAVANEVTVVRMQREELMLPTRRQTLIVEYDAFDTEVLESVVGSELVRQPGARTYFLEGRPVLRAETAECLQLKKDGWRPRE